MPLPASRPGRIALAVLASISLTSGVLAWRDLGRRPAGAVRGDKRIWRVAILLNSGNSVAYWLFGRR